MTTLNDEQQILISGYLDGELDAEQRRQLERLLSEDVAFRREFEDMKSVVAGTTAALQPDQPPDEVWDGFLDGVYNRLERKTGWLAFIAGFVLLVPYAVYAFVVYDWGPALVKLGVAAVVVGLALLFISVLRQRLKVARTDRYSREVHR